MSLSIVETYSTLQCEGTRIVPAILLRLSGCNFRCQGFGVQMKSPKTGETLIGCDTIRATYTEHFNQNYKTYENWLDLIDDLEAIMPKYSKHNFLKPDLVITGGEPLLNWRNPILQNVINYFISRGHKVTIETNGSVPIEFFRKYQNEIMFSISVKLAVSGEPKEKRFKPENIANIIEHCPTSYLKFVTSEASWEQDYAEMKEFLKAIPIWVPVILMPLGATKEELDKNTRFVVERCVEYGFGYSDRIHIRAWNDKEGV